MPTSEVVELPPAETEIVKEHLGDLARVGKLGLAGMQERTNLIGGTLTAQSEPGKGSTITIELPA